MLLTVAISTFKSTLPPFSFTLVSLYSHSMSCLHIYCTFYIEAMVTISIDIIEASCILA